jgi:hypothetical protein
VTVIAIIIKTLFTFGDSYEIVIATSRSYIKEVGSSFPSFYTLTVQAFVTAIVPVFVKIFIIVRHNAVFK